MGRERAPVAFAHSCFPTPNPNPDPDPDPDPNPNQAGMREEYDAAQWRNRFHPTVVGVRVRVRVR